MEFINATQQNTVKASGATKVRSPCTMFLAWLLTISTSISTAHCIFPGTPEVAFLAPARRRKNMTASINTEKKMVS